MLNLRGVTQRQFAFNIVEKHMHPQRLSKNAKLGPDMTIANNTELFTARFKRARSLFIPDTAVRFGVGFRNAAQ